MKLVARLVRLEARALETSVADARASDYLVRDYLAKLTDAQLDVLESALQREVDESDPRAMAHFGNLTPQQTVALYERLLTEEQVREAE